MEDVAKIPYLVPPKGRRRTYYFRKRIPEQLHKIIGKTEFSESLETADFKTAKSRCFARAVEVDIELKQAETLLRQLPASDDAPKAKFRLPLKLENARELAKLWYHRRHAGIERTLTMQFSYVSVEESKNEVPKYAKRKKRFQQKESKSLAFARSEAKAIVREFGFNVITAAGDKRAGPFHLLADYIRRAEVEVCRFAELYIVGEENEFDAADFIKDADPAKTESKLRAVNDRVKLRDLIAAHKNDKKILSLKPASKKKWGTFYKLIQDFFEPGFDVKDMDRSAFKEFRDFIEEAPLRVPTKYKGFSKREVWEETRGQGHATRSAKTVNDLLTYLHGLMEFATREKYARENEAKGLLIPDRKKRSNRDEFSSHDIKLIFAHPLYRGCMDDERRYNIPGSNIIKRGRFWSFLIAFYTGMRQAEIFQLHTTDMKCEGGVWYFDINETIADGADYKSVKSEAGWRKVPVHDELIKIGFITFVEKQQRRGLTRLFDDLPVSKSIDPANTFQKWCIRFLKDAGAYVKGEKAFHSIRHTFITTMRRCSVPREMVEEVSGHSTRKGEHNTYYKGERLQALQSAINKLEYEDLDLSHLYEG